MEFYFKDKLDEQLYMEINGKVEKIKFLSGDKLTIRNICECEKTLMYEEKLKKVEKCRKGEEVENKTKSPHRKKMFSEEEVEKIRHEYVRYNTPKKELARKYKCSPKTIRNILNNAY